MDDPLRGIEAEIPALRCYARFLLHDPEVADDLAYAMTARMGRPELRAIAEAVYDEPRS